MATGSRFDRDLIAINHPIHIERWIRFTSDRDRLNLIRNSGRSIISDVAGRFICLQLLLFMLFIVERILAYPHTLKRNTHLTMTID